MFRLTQDAECCVSVNILKQHCPIIKSGRKLKGYPLGHESLTLGGMHSMFGRGFN